MASPVEAKVRPSARLGAHEGRLQGDYDDTLVQSFYKANVDRTKFLFTPVMQYNRAHVVMLTEQGILDREKARPLLQVLDEVDALGVDAIDFDPKLQSVYPNIEALVIDKAGYAVGGMLYIGRTRGDAQRVPASMAFRDLLLDVISGLIVLREALLDVAAQHVETVMPGYTNLQHAQPMTFGFYLLMFAESFEADFQRLCDAYRRLNVSAAEIGGGMTTSYAIDRHRIAELLGFEGIIENALLAHRAVDREIETLSALGLLVLDVHRLCDDLIIWCSSDVGFMEMGDQFSATSFMMAQKKNPHALYYAQIAAVAIQQALQAAYSMDMRNTSEVILKSGELVVSTHDSLRRTVATLRLMTGVLPSLILQKDLMRNAIDKTYSQVTDLTDTLVREADLSFREAHRVVGTLVRRAIEQGVLARDISLPMLDAAAQEALGHTVKLAEATLRRALDPVEGVRAKQVFGGVAPERANEALERRRQSVREDQRWVDEKRAVQQHAAQLLDGACASILAA